MSSYYNLIKISSKKLEEINKNQDNYDKKFWGKLAIFYKLPEEFIEKNWEYLDIDDISSWQNLSEEFIRKHIEKLNIYSVSSHQNLSIDFLREFFNKLNSKAISLYQEIDKDFIKDFYEKLYLNEIKIRNLIEDFMSEEELDSLIVMKKLISKEE